MKRFLIFVVVILLLYIQKTYALEIKEFTINKDTIWSGEIIVPDTITVQRHVTLTILPGTVVRFTNPSAGLDIEGNFVANGLPEQKIIFTSNDADTFVTHWQGIVFYGAAKGEQNTFSQLSNCVIKQAQIGLKFIQGAKGKIENCIFTRNNQAILFSQSSEGTLSNCDFIDNFEGGILCEQAYLKIMNSRFANNSNFAITCVKNSEVDIDGNFIEKHRYGIILSLSGTLAGIKNNIIQGNEFGIFAERLAQPSISNNTLKDNGYGIYLERGARPKISMNEITNNKTGIFIMENLNLVINDNNIYENKEYEIGLKEVSSEYMRKLKQSITDKKDLEKIPPCMREELMSSEVSPEYIDARKNFWGEELTKEIKAKGKSANISKILDFYDNPSAGEKEGAEQNKENFILYSGWREKPVESAGAEKKSSYGVIK